MSGATIPDWIAAISTAVGSLAVVVGLFKANSKISEAQNTAKQLRRSQVAEELISLALSVEDALRDVRHPLTSIPLDRVKDPVFSYQQRLSRLASYDELFRKLRDAQIRVKALVGNAKVDQAVDSLFRARNQVVVSLQALAEYASLGSDEINAQDREFKVTLRKTISGAGSADDELGVEVAASVKTIEIELNPIARLEAQK